METPKTLLFYFFESSNGELRASAPRCSYQKLENRSFGAKSGFWVGAGGNPQNNAFLIF